MGKLNVHLFGKFAVCDDRRALAGLESRKAQELFCYLLLHNRHPHPREALADLLWGETSTAQSKTYLRKALWQLQRELGAHDSAPHSQLLLIEHDWVQINPQADLWLDVAAFEHAFNAVQGIPGEQLDSSAAEGLRQAVDLYQGELLGGWYQDWCLYERERLQNIYLAALDKLMGYCERQREYERGLVYGAQILRYDRAREQTHRRLMRLHALAGDRTAALRQFDRCAAALEEELGVKPTEYTLALYEQIKTNRLHSQAPAPDPQPSCDEATPLSEALARLNHLQQTLSEFQRRIQHDIQIVEQALRDRR